jgi:hypothetical protein
MECVKGFSVNCGPWGATRFRLIAWLRKSSSAAISRQTTEEAISEPWLVRNAE